MTGNAQIKPGEWNAQSPGANISIVLYENGVAAISYSSRTADGEAKGRWKTMTEGKYAGCARLDLTIEYVNTNGTPHGEGATAAPIYIQQVGNQAFIVNSTNIGGIEINISLKLRHTGYRHKAPPVGNG